MKDNEKPEDIQAFPMDYRHEGYRMEQGMTLRDYFAAKAMQAIISGGVEVKKGTIQDAYDYVSEQSYIVADAMLKERTK